MCLKLKIICVLIFLLLSFFTIRPLILADGCIFMYDPDLFLWETASQAQQLSAVNYENGVENMILAVDLKDLRGEKAVWLLPIPASPEKTEIDIIKGFPRPWGRDIKTTANDAIWDTFSLMRLSQLYTFPFYFLMQSFVGMDITRGGLMEEVTVYEHIEKMGVTSELIGTEDGEALYRYFTSKGLNLPSKAKPLVDKYVGEDYSFIASWISDVEMFKQVSSGPSFSSGTLDTVGVFVRFPTDKIFYPLRLTSMYENQRVPILIYAMNHITCEIPKNLQKDTQVDYFLDREYQVPPNLTQFFNGKTDISDLKYTKIKIETSAENLTSDLWMKDSAPTGVILAGLVQKHSFKWGLVIFVICSCLASMVAGRVVFGKEQLPPRKFALLGLSNFLTLLGFLLVGLVVTKRLVGPGDHVPLKKAMRTTLFITLIVLLLLAWPRLENLASVWVELISAPLFYVYLALTYFFTFSFVWAYYNQRKTLGFTVLFSISFLVFTVVFQLALYSLVAIFL